ETSGFFNRDADGSPAQVTHTENFDYYHQQFSQELQIIGTGMDGQLKYTAGAYYFNEKGRDFLIVSFPPTFGVLLNKTTVDNDSLGGFAQATFDATDTLSITGGIRYSKDTKAYDPLQILTVGPVGAGAFGVAPGDGVALIPPVADEATFTNWSPRVSLEYRVTEDVLTYASYTQGFKSGGFNIRYLLPVPAPIRFTPETVKSWEVGLKMDLFDNRVRLNTAGFFAKYDDIQVVTYIAGAPLTTNGGKAEIKGIEVELTALVSEQFELTAGLGYIDAKYTEVPAFDTDLPTVIQITKDKKIANTPEWSLNASGEYTVPLADDAELAFRADWSYKSRIENDAQNSPFLSQPGYHIINASVTYYHAGDDWHIRLFVDNLTDQRYISSGDSNFGLGFHEANYNRPREWGAALKINF
ncbi:MAG: TonB-dependent receptor, partial [Alphaproteobacteria bacterium]